MISNPEEVNKMEAEFIEEIQKRGADFKYFQDVFGDIPDDRSAKLEEKTEKLEKATTLSNIFGALKEKVRKIIFSWFHEIIFLKALKSSSWALLIFVNLS